MVDQSWVEDSHLQRRELASKFRVTRQTVCEGNESLQQSMIRRGHHLRRSEGRIAEVGSTAGRARLLHDRTARDRATRTLSPPVIITIKRELIWFGPVMREALMIVICQDDKAYRYS